MLALCGAIPLLTAVALAQEVSDAQYPPAAQPASPPAPPPNIVLIVADDLGYGDLGCYGQDRIATPRIDRLAAAGCRFTSFYAGSTVCAPSRAVLMTGMHTGHCEIRGNGKQNLRAETVTLAEVLSEGGYATGLFGKWGIGHEGSEGLPTRQGFDTFFGYLDQHHAHNHFPSFLVRDEERVRLRNTVPQEGKYGQGVATAKIDYSHDLITDAALAFVGEHAAEPFFMTLAWTLPHANNEAGRQGMEVPAGAPYGDRDWPAPERGFAAMVARLDRDVGRLVDLLEELGITHRTLVLFTSDNGPHNEGGHRAAFFDSSGPLSGTKRSLTEGGIRVPLIASWPGTIGAGRTADHAAGFWDLMPTLAELAGVERHVPESTDGLSFAPTLLGELGQRPAPYQYWAFYEGGGAQALRRGRWKVVQQPMASAPRLYDLERDLGEREDLAPTRSEVLAELVDLMEQAYRPSPRWKLPTEKH
ncbi:MAG: N-acetylgalactosamine-6-sulfatase [Planctomycetes bacterium]|nr:N-acetylgalactosamine-6-sulfatase [Planctomycetota bacterium]